MTVISLAAAVLTLVAQLTNQTPSDARSNQFNDVKGTSWRVFAIESYAAGPLALTEVQEVRQQNPPSTWAVFATNRSLMPIPSYTLAAAVVTGDGTVKAIQPLPAIKNLQPGKVSRQETRIRVTVLIPSDRVVFFVSEVSSEMGPWKASSNEVAASIKTAAKQLPAQ